MLATGFAALVALVLASGGKAEFVVNIPGTLTISRMDPIANPGDIAGHVHRIVGASNFNAGLNTPEEQLATDCTTVQIGADKSNYWAPSLYWINKNGTYSILPHAIKVYYHINDNKQKVQAFPKGLRMISGLAMRRDVGHPAAQGFQINMDPYVGGPAYNNQYLPNGTIYGPTPPKGDYIHMNIYFPSCGRADQQLDSDDHFSHMSWPISDNGRWDITGGGPGRCPESHPIMYPTIFLESFFYIDKRMKSEWNPTGPNLILSNGDVTGTTFHADFVNGWETDVLQGAIDHCADVGEDVEKCPAFVPTLQKGAENDCRYQGQIPDEDVGFKEPLKDLPGCNPRWDWDGPANKPNSPADCPWYKKPGWTSPNLQYVGPHHASSLFPVVLPGVNVDMNNLGGLGVPLAGRGGWPAPKYVPWAKTQAGQDVNNVLKGTQTEVNANVVPNADNSQCKLFGRGTVGNGYQGRYPDEKIKDLAGAIAGSGGKFTETYRCRQPAYLPCGPPPAAKRRLDQNGP